MTLKKVMTTKNDKLLLTKYSLVTVDHYSVYDCVKKVPKDSKEKKSWKIKAKYFH